MDDLLVTRTEPEGAALAVAWRRLRGAPSLWLPVVLAAGATAVRVVAWSNGADAWRWGTLSASLWVAIVAALVGVTLRPLFRELLREPCAERPPIRVRWLDAPPAAGAPFADREAQVLPTALRIVSCRQSGRDRLLLVLLAAVVGGIAMGWLGPLAAWALAWAFGFPRPVRLAVEVPWEDVESVVRAGDHFRVQRTAGRSDLVLEARYSQAERLQERLGARLADRLRGSTSAVRGELRPAVLRPAPGDEDAGVAQLILRRGPWQVRAAAFCMLGAAAFALVGRMAGPIYSVVAGVLALVGVIFVFTIQSRGKLWSGHVPAADDSLDPVAVRWTNRPGFPGPGPHQVHLLPDRLRVVGAEWEMWDVLVVVAAGIAALPLGSVWYPLGAVTLLGTIGIPRRRRVVVDIPWGEVTLADVRGGKFEIRSDLPAPADLVRVEAKFAARERLTAALVERLGDRAVLASAGRPARTPAA